MKKAYIWTGAGVSAVAVASLCWFGFSGKGDGSGVAAVQPAEVVSSQQSGAKGAEGKTDAAPQTPSVAQAAVPKYEPPPVEPPKPPFPKIPVPGTVLSGGVAQSFPLAVATSSQEAQDLVLSGFHHLLTNWDSAASYAFQRAAALDPNCALAQFGVYLSLSSPGNEREAAGKAAYEQLKTMVKSEGLPDRERAYLEAAVALHDEGAPAAGIVFAAICERWKADLPARLFAALMLHDRYDEQGNPSPHQQKAIALLDEALETNADNHALLFTRALMEEAAPVPSETAVNAVQKAAGLTPGHAPTRHLLGHVLFRKGQYAEAAKAFEETAALYDKTRNPLNATMATDSGWLKALLYRAAALFCEGKQNTAWEEAGRIARLPLDETRPKAEGTLMQEWECLSLPTRMMMGYDSPDMLKKAKAILPDYSGKAPVADDRPSELLIKALDGYLEFRIALLSKKDNAAASKAYESFREIRHKFEGTGALAQSAGAGSYWSRGQQMLDLLNGDCLARLNKTDAESWRRSSAEKQLFTSLLMPPSLLYPVEYEWAEELEGQGKDAPAFAQLPLVIAAGLKRFPNHVDLLRLQARVDGKTAPAYEPIEAKSVAVSSRSSASRSKASPVKQKASRKKSQPVRRKTSSTRKKSRK